MSEDSGGDNQSEEDLLPAAELQQIQTFLEEIEPIRELKRTGRWPADSSELDGYECEVIPAWELRVRNGPMIILLHAGFRVDMDVFLGMDGDEDYVKPVDEEMKTSRQLPTILRQMWQFVDDVTSRAQNILAVFRGSETLIAVGGSQVFFVQLKNESSLSTRKFFREYWWRTRLTVEVVDRSALRVLLYNVDLCENMEENSLPDRSKSARWSVKRMYELTELAAAFAMGLHDRIGADSHVLNLSADVVKYHILLPYVLYRTAGREVLRDELLQIMRITSAIQG